MSLSILFNFYRDFNFIIIRRCRSTRTIENGDVSLTQQTLSMFNDNFSKCAVVPSIYLFAEVNDTETLQRSVIPRGSSSKKFLFFPRRNGRPRGRYVVVTNGLFLRRRKFYRCIFSSSTRGIYRLLSEKER